MGHQACGSCVVTQMRPSCRWHVQPCRLSDEVFEMMLWKLEVSNAAATERALTFAGDRGAWWMVMQGCTIRGVSC